MPSSPDRPRTLPEPLRIINWPPRDDRGWAWSTAVCILAVAAVAGTLADSLVMGFFVLAALVVSVWRMWFPITFDFGVGGVIQTCFGRRRRIPWHQITRCEVLARGILLSADSERTPLTPLRSLYIRWNGQQEELIKVVEFFLNTHEPTSAVTTQTYRE